MSLRPTPELPVPEETARVIRQAFPHGHPYLTLRDTFGALFTDDRFAALFPSRGQPAEAPWRLALVTLLQFAEGLSDRQAADTVRSSLLWKYLAGTDRSRLPLQCSLRIPRPPGRRGGGKPAVRHPPGALPGTPVAQRARAAAHGLHPHPSRRA